MAITSASNILCSLQEKITHVQNKGGKYLDSGMKFEIFVAYCLFYPDLTDCLNETLVVSIKVKFSLLAPWTADWLSNYDNLY